MLFRSLEQAPPPPPPPRRRSSNGGRPVITEIDEEEEGDDGDRQANHGAYVQEPDDENDGRVGTIHALSNGMPFDRLILE